MIEKEYVSINKPLFKREKGLANVGILAVLSMLCISVLVFYLSFMQNI